MSSFVRYPRTQHVQGSRFQHGDHDLDAVPWNDIKGKYLVVEEKMDGANAGISFEDGTLMLQSRGHFLRGGPREKHFARFKQWAAARETELYLTLSDRYVMFGEWMYAKHTCFYDMLPHYFMEFDLYDKVNNVFLSTLERKSHYQATCVATIVSPVLVLASSTFKHVEEVRLLLGRSRFKSENWRDNLRLAAQRASVSSENVESHTDLSDNMEGLYIKWEDEHHVLGRYKLVRESFTNNIMDQEEHWLNRTVIQNGLAVGAEQRMFE